MTYDLSIYSASPPCEVEAATPEAPICLKKTRSWRVLSYGTDRVEPEDLPAQVEASLPGLRFLSCLHIESAGTSRAAVQEAKRIARAMAKRSFGVVVDEQEESLETPRGVSRLAEVEGAADEEGRLCLGWYFMDADRMSRDGVAALLAIMETSLPEMLPRRYGAWEPPQHKWESDGRAHFLATFGESPSGVVWYPHKPATYFSIGVPDPPGQSQRGFRCCYLQASVRAAVLKSHAWRVQLQRFFVRISRLVQPFYAEIRVGSTIPSSWWWNGIPPIHARVVVLGSPYLELWSDFRGGAKQISKDLFLAGDLEVWPGCGRERFPSVPTVLARPPSGQFGVEETTGDVLWYKIGADRALPEVWPF